MMKLGEFKFEARAVEPLPKKQELRCDIGNGSVMVKVDWQRENASAQNTYA